MMRELSVEGPAMSVRPIDHWRYRETVAPVVFARVSLVNHDCNVRLICSGSCGAPTATYQHLQALIKRKAEIVQSAEL
jgi:hypothetical protein